MAEALIIKFSSMSQPLLWNYSQSASKLMLAIILIFVGIIDVLF